MPYPNRFNHRDCVLLVIVAWFAMGLAVRAWAQPLDDLSSGSLFLQHAGAAGPSPALRLATDVHIRVAGMLATVEVRQQFANDSADFAEGIYAFPLPEEAAVNRMIMQIGKRRIESEIHEKKDAARIYRSARAAGQRASLLEQQRPILFTSRVANLAPGEDIIVQISYVQPLEYQSGQFRLRFPMALTPRYDDAVSPAAGQAARHEVNPTRIEVQLVPGFDLTRLASLYHDVTIAQSNGRYAIALRDQVVAAEKDFELVWEPALGSAAQAALFTDSDDHGHYALLMIMPPAVKSTLDRPRELILVIDSSGSMFGDSLQQAKASLVMALGTLAAGDRFNVIDFDTEARSLFTTAQPADDPNIGRAIEFVSSLSADGGTNISAALTLALAEKSGGDHLRQVVFVTDGSVSNEASLFAQIETEIADSRLFTVAIGAAPNAYFMRKAASFGRGSYTFIGSEAMVAERMDELLLRLERPALTDLCVDWPGFAESYPSRLPDLYAGEPLIVTARLDSLAGTADVCGSTPLDSWNLTVDLKADTPESGVATLWARRKISQLMDELALGAPPAEIRPQIVETALRHRLVSRYTSFVAVDKSIVREPPESLKTDRMAALSGGALAMDLPLTATDGPLRFAFGVLLLVLGVVVSQRLRSDS